MNTLGKNQYPNKCKIGEEYTTKEGYKIKIIEFFDTKDCTILFNNGVILKNKQYTHIKSGSVKNPYHKTMYNMGYVGEGKYKTTINKKVTSSYGVWTSLLRRCYSGNNVNYLNCSVDERWLNFQNFAEWYENNYPKKVDFELDKDILVKGNKVYSPETCCFVPKDINNLFRNREKGKYLLGVQKKGNNFVAKIKRFGKAKHLGIFTTQEEAFLKYKESKEELMKEAANRWKDVISKEVYQVLINYKA